MTVKFVSEVYSIKAPPSERATLLTGEELFAMGDIGRAELVKGRLIRMSPTGFLHGVIESNLGGILSEFVNQHGLGVVVVGEVGIYTSRNPDTVRGADVAFISNEQLARVKSPGYLEVAPELVVEVLSPNDSWSEVNEKLGEYFGIGVQIVWVVDPRQREVYVYRALTDVERFTTEDVLSGAEVLPGFKVTVVELFGEV